jgi:hypothetical protein
MRPILFASLSVNQRFPSEPTVIPKVEAFGVGIANSVVTPAVVILAVVTRLTPT